MDIFKQWEIDIVGSLPQTEDRYRYIVMAIDYFFRWLKGITKTSGVGSIKYMVYNKKFTVYAVYGYTIHHIPFLLINV